MAFQVTGGIAQVPEGAPWPGCGPGHHCPVHIETTIGEWHDSRRQPAHPRNFPFLRCPRPNGGADQGYIRPGLRTAMAAPVDLPSLQALRRPGFRYDRSMAGLAWSRSVACPHPQISGGSQDVQTTDTRPSPLSGNTSPGFPSHASSCGLPPRSAAQRMAPSARADGFRRQTSALPDNAGICAPATRPAALRRPL